MEQYETIEIKSENGACVQDHHESLEVSVREPELAPARNDFYEPVENWMYRGLANEFDFGDEEDRWTLRNYFWHEVKQLCGKLVTIIVEISATDDEQKQDLIIRICGYSVNRGKVVNEPMASITVSAKKGESLYFLFKIIDANLATACNVSVEILKQACERVFGTIVLRCLKQSGDDDIQ